MTRRAFALVLVLGLLLLACDSASGDSEVELSEEKKAEVSENSQATIEATTGLQSLKDNPGDGDVFSRLSQVFSKAQALWNTKTAAKYGSNQAAAGSSAGLMAHETLIGALEAGCYALDQTQVTYDQCGEQGMVINGTIAIEGDTIAIDLTITMDGGVSIAYSGSVTITETSIDGSLNILYTIDYPDSDMVVEYDVTITYGTVVMDETGCPIAGSMTIKVGMDTQGGTGGLGGLAGASGASGATGSLGGYGSLSGAAIPTTTIEFEDPCGTLSMY
jgi:hypothetical protein